MPFRRLKNAIVVRKKRKIVVKKKLKSDDTTSNFLYEVLGHVELPLRNVTCDWLISLERESINCEVGVELLHMVHARKPEKMNVPPY